MPLIEEVPITAGSNSRTSHGWAYVPDTSFAHARAPVSAAAPRNKRLAREAHRQGAGRDTSAKQAKAIAARLADLDKENWKDAAPVAVPTATVTKTKGKVTPNVRRILTSGRNFTHWLAAEEAEHQNQASSTHTTAATGASSQRQSSRAVATPGKPTSAELMPPPPRAGAKVASPSPAVPASTSTPTSSTQTKQPNPTSTLHVNPLLVSHVPKLPSQRIMDILVSEPPLTWNAARGTPSKRPLPPRHFCSICGYWGKVKCLKCGDRTCGRMECWKGHEETCQVVW